MFLMSEVPLYLTTMTSSYEGNSPLQCEDVGNDNHCSDWCLGLKGWVLVRVWDQGLGVGCWVRCQSIAAHTKHSRLESGLEFRVCGVSSTQNWESFKFQKSR